MTIDNETEKKIDILKGITVKKDGSFKFVGGPNGPFSAGSKNALERFKQLAEEQHKTVAEIICGQVSD